MKKLLLIFLILLSSTIFATRLKKNSKFNIFTFYPKVSIGITSLGIEQSVSLEFARKIDITLQYTYNLRFFYHITHYCSLNLDYNAFTFHVEKYSLPLNITFGITKIYNYQVEKTYKEQNNWFDIPSNNDYVWGNMISYNYQISLSPVFFTIKNFIFFTQLKAGILFKILNQKNCEKISDIFYYGISAGIIVL